MFPDPPSLRRHACTAGLVLALSAPALAQQDFVVSSGVTLYDTSSGPLLVDSLVVEDGATLRVTGARPFVVLARREIRVEGLVDLSGFDARSVSTLNTGGVPEPGAAGAAGGGAGGTASATTTSSTAAGGPGASLFGGGGGGGESGYSPSSVDDDRRPGSGGGGALAASQPVSADPDDPANAGLVATAGGDGAPSASGALSGSPPPRGGLAGSAVFVDGDPTNDFFGRKLVPGLGLIQGELAGPVPGSGGGAGGDALPSASFPTPGWTPASDEKGAGGGGGGGVGLLATPLFVLGSAGAVRSDGGDGALGENTFFLNHIGGSSGGGSGGYLVVAAQRIDLSRAGARSLSALGGLGADPPEPGPVAHGGDGGPGVIQLHVPPGPGHLLLPSGASLGELSAPKAHVLLPLGAIDLR